MGALFNQKTIIINTKLVRSKAILYVVSSIPKSNLFGYYAATEFVDGGKTFVGPHAKAARFKKFFNLDNF